MNVWKGGSERERRLERDFCVMEKTQEKEEKGRRVSSAVTIGHYVSGGSDGDILEKLHIRV